MLSSFFKSILKFFQIVAVGIIPIIVASYLFPTAPFLSFMVPLRTHTLEIVSLFTKTTVIGDVELGVVFVVLPWIIYIIIAGITINIINGLEVQASHLKTQLEAKKVQEMHKAREQEAKNELQKKTLTYVVLDLSFERFTISNLTEEESEKRKEDTRRKSLSFIQNYKGMLVQSDNIEFENEFANAVIFPTQEDALNFLIKYSNAMPIIDDEIQNMGYSVHYKGILDVQEPNANQYTVLEFLEKALGTAAQNEIIATNSFVEKHNNFSTMKRVSFVSKGTYSINKQKVELNHLQF